MSTRSTFEPQLQYVLRIADSSLIHGQRLSAWCGHAPVLEEDIALANIALDHVGQARALLTLAGQMEGRGRDEDAFAYSRIEREFFNVTMLELPNGDFARTLMRGFLWSAFLGALWPELAASSNAQLGAISAKCAKETRYHQRHCADWVLRLGDGTPESHQRVAAALLDLWPYTAEWFADDAVDAHAAAANLGPAWSTLQDAWLGAVQPVLVQAGLRMPAPSPFRSTGKVGRHSEHMGFLLAEMQSLAREFPAGVW
ncbi:MAG: 1,2-phenylacetyl-CoA epoxidase subunit PaaC [Burkholderiaceae bacterium]